jgi:hypothetical protein
MKVEEIIEQLCNRTISKQVAIKQITMIVDGFRKYNAIEFTVKESGFTVENNHGYLKLELPYQYSKMEGTMKQGDKVDVTLLP